MRMLTVVKRVPDSRAAVKVRADGGGIETGGLKHVCDPFDEFGVAQPVLLKGQRADVEQITAMAGGPAETVEVLRYAVAMGVDRAIHVTGDDLPMHDEIAMARILAGAIGQDGPGYDLILCGKQNIDNDAGELGPALAELLDLPHVGAVTAMELSQDGASLRAHRRIEGAEEIVQASLPVLVTCEKGLIEPKVPPLPKLMKAKKHEVETIEAEHVAPSGSLVRLAPPPARPACQMIEGEPPEMARQLVQRLRDEAKVL